MDNLFTSLEEKIKEAKQQHHQEVQIMKKDLTRDLENLKHFYKNQIQSVEKSFTEETQEIKEKFSPIWKIFTIATIFLLGVGTTLIIMNQVKQPSLRSIQTKDGAYYKVPKDLVIEVDWDKNNYYIKKE